VLRPARLDECSLLSALALRSKAVWGYSPEFLEGCADALTVREQHFPHVIVSEVDSALAGFYALAPLPPGRAELEFLFVDPPHLGRGHGRALLEHARHSAREAFGARVIEISGDPNADRFYRRAGARLVGERPSESFPGRMLPFYELDC